MTLLRHRWLRFGLEKHKHVLPNGRQWGRRSELGSKVQQEMLISRYFPLVRLCPILNSFRTIISIRKY
jgi:hypothetical protein